MKTTYPSTRPSEQNSIYKEKQGARFSSLGSPSMPCSRYTTDTERDQHQETFSRPGQDHLPAFNATHATISLRRMDLSYASSKSSYSSLLSFSQCPTQWLASLSTPQSHADLKAALLLGTLKPAYFL